MPTRNLTIAKVSEADVKKILLFIQFLDLVSLKLYEQEEYLDFMKQNYEADEIALFNSFLDQDNKFNYEKFFVEINNVLSGRFKVLVVGYQTLIENFCNPNSSSLEPSENLFIKEENDLGVRAQEVCEFANFNSWVQNAKDWLGCFSQKERIVCFDSEGNALTCGEDFQYARDNNMFPIKAYRMIRNTEEKIVKSVSNN